MGWLRSGWLLAAMAGLVVVPAAQAGLGARIKVALHVPLSGEQAVQGEGIARAARLALGRFRVPVERAGFRVELAPFDDQAKAHVGVANARTLVADPAVLAVIGHLSVAVALPASEVYREAGLALITPAVTAPLLTDRGYPNVNRTCGRDDGQGWLGAEFGADVLKAARAYVVHGSGERSRRIAEVFREAWVGRGLEVVGFESAGEGARRGALLAAIRSRTPDVVFVAGGLARAAALAAEAREAGLGAKFLTAGGSDAAGRRRAGEGAATGLYYTTVGGRPSPSPAAEEFTGEYRRWFGREPEPLAAYAYDAVAVGLRAIAQAVGEAGGRMPTRAAVAEAARKLRHRGVTGVIEFDDRGDRRAAPYGVFQVVSDDPARWSEDREIRRVEIARPPGPR